METDLTLEEANLLERFYIDKYNSYYEGYNRTRGGDNGIAEPKAIYINRTPVDMTAGHNFVAYETFELFNLLDQLTLTEFKIFNYLVALNPNTINGHQNPKGPSKPFKLLPSELHKAYPATSAQTFKLAINSLIEKEILRPTKLPNLYTFDNRPMKYRSKTVAEANEIYELSAEEAYRGHHRADIYAEMKSMS